MFAHLDSIGHVLESPWPGVSAVRGHKNELRVICILIEWWTPQRALLRLEHNKKWPIIVKKAGNSLALAWSWQRIPRVPGQDVYRWPGLATKECAQLGQSEMSEIECIVPCPAPRRSWDGYYEGAVFQQRSLWRPELAINRCGSWMS